MQHTLPILIGKLVKRISGWRGGGSALPGLVIEKLDPHLLPKALEQLPHGVVVISEWQNNHYKNGGRTA